jgi:hypothetical protein
MLCAILQPVSYHGLAEDNAVVRVRNGLCPCIPTGPCGGIDADILEGMVFVSAENIIAESDRQLHKGVLKQELSRQICQEPLPCQVKDDISESIEKLHRVSDWRHVTPPVSEFRGSQGLELLLADYPLKVVSAVWDRSTFFPNYIVL